MKRNVTQMRGQAMGKERPFYIQIVLYAALTIASLLVPRATVYGGLAPFGVSVAACAGGSASLLVYLGASVGYFLSSDIVMPLRYLTAIAVVGGVRWVFGGVNRVTKHVLFVPLLAASATFITGLAMNMIQGFQLGVLVSELCEAMLAGGAAYFFEGAVSVFKSDKGPRTLSLPEQSSLVITAAVILMALHAVEFADISIGRILTMAVLLLAAKAGTQQGGMLAGIVLGSATALAAPSYSHLAAAYAFGGLLAGLFARFGRLSCAMVFLLTNILVVLSTGQRDAVVIGVYEVAAAAALFLITPLSVERQANALFSRVQTISPTDGLRRSVDMRLVYASQTMSEIAKTVDAVSEKLTAMTTPTLKEVYTEVCASLCQGCRRRDMCWKEHFADTMASFRAMGQHLRDQGTLRVNDIDAVFRTDCHHIDQVVSLMNSGYARFIMKDHAFRRLSDIRSIVTDQFEGMALLLKDLSEDLHTLDRTDERATARVEQLCLRYRLPLAEAVCMIGRRNRTTAQLLIEGDNVPPEGARFYRELADACGCVFGAPDVSPSGYLTRIRLTEKPKFSIKLGVAQLNCRAETLCGDAYEQFYDHDGRYCVVLSDGMGTGGRAAVDGAMTAALAGRMLQAGFHYDSIVRIINSSLIIKSGDESLSTLDAIRVDPFTGHLHGLKAGAAPSFLFSNGRLTKLSATSLPIGILNDITCEEYSEYVSKGDVFVMVSDGVTEGGSEWLEDLICRLVQRNTDEKNMASEIVFTARERQDSKRGDDTTALVLRVA